MKEINYACIVIAWLCLIAVLIEPSCKLILYVNLINMFVIFTNGVIMFYRIYKEHIKN